MASKGTRTRDTFIYIFYHPTATNHPLIQGDPLEATCWPNWYYYWRQTSASAGSHSYDAGLAYPGITRWDSLAGAWQIFIGPPCYRAQGNPSPVVGWGFPWGIDHFAWICRHEEQHLWDLIGEWGQSPRNPQLDGDGDFLHSSYEDQKLPGGPHGAQWYSWLQYATFTDHFFYGGSTWSDIEDWCLHRQWGWTNGAADQEDWSQQGKMDVFLPSP